MRKLEKNTRRYFVNLFADYILSKFDKKENTIIQVTDFETFVVVNGQTTSNNVLNLNDIKVEFIKSNKDLFDSLEKEDLNIIDIIKYEQEITDFKEITDFGDYERLISQLIYNTTGKQLGNYDSDSYRDVHILTKKGFEEKKQPYEIISQIIQRLEKQRSLTPSQLSGTDSAQSAGTSAAFNLSQVPITGKGQKCPAVALPIQRAGARLVASMLPSDKRKKIICL